MRTAVAMVAASLLLVLSPGWGSDLKYESALQLSGVEAGAAQELTVSVLAWSRGLCEAATFEVGRAGTSGSGKTALLGSATPLSFVLPDWTKITANQTSPYQFVCLEVITLHSLKTDAHLYQENWPRQ